MSLPIETPPTLETATSNTTISRYKETPGEMYMNARQKEHLRKVLETERLYWMEVQARMVSEFLQKKSGHLSSDAADIANREIEVRSAVRGREHRLIKKIDDALARLNSDRNQYGFCEVCHAPIGIKRLEVRPTATLCFDCKTLDEIREKQTGNH